MRLIFNRSAWMLLKILMQHIHYQFLSWNEVPRIHPFFQVCTIGSCSSWRRLFLSQCHTYFGCWWSPGCPFEPVVGKNKFLLQAQHEWPSIIQPLLPSPSRSIFLSSQWNSFVSIFHLNLTDKTGFYANKNYANIKNSTELIFVVC